MIRLTRKVFTDLAIWMTGLGLLMGILFPFFVVLLGVPGEYALTPWFFAATMIAGFLVGGANIWLARSVVGGRLHILTDRMRFVEVNLREVTRTGETGKCTPEKCHVRVDSEDEIGESAKAFNYLIDALASSHRNDAAVRSFGAILASQLDLDILVDKALGELLRHMGADAGAILTAAEGLLNVAASEGIRTPNALIHSDHVRHTLNSQHRLYIALPDDVSIDGILTEFRPREVIVEPIVYKGVPLGAMILGSATEFTDEMKLRLDQFSQGLSLAMNNAMTYDRLQKLAALDPLTGVYNRRFGMARLGEEFVRAIRTNGPVGIMMLDIDHFKKVNDSYGHLAGDRVLVQVAKTARAALREGDILMRYGGEEFLIILPAASKSNARDISEKLRHMVEGITVTDGDQTIRVTISIGATSFPEFTASNDEDLVKRADELLYSAKESGRNRVVAG